MPRLIPEMLEGGDESLLHEAMSEAFKNGLHSVWPQAKELTLADIEFVLVPLDRVGSAPGFSGAKVLIAYYADVRQILQSSHPFVVKIAEGDKVLLEFNNATSWAPIARPHQDRFARPASAPLIKGRRGVLLAPFSSSIKIRSGTTRYDMHIEDLWRRLIDAERKDADPNNWASVSKSVDDVVRLIAIAHSGGRRSIPRQMFKYLDEYEWYLRGTYKPNKPEQDNSDLVERLFGTNPTTRALGRDWPNPVHVIARLERERPEFEGASGYIHGDLHPRNVVFDNNNLPYIIDFGWAQRDRHVVKDFVMLDVNLRAMNAPPHAQPSDVVSLATFLSPGDDPAVVAQPLRHRAQLVKKQIWQPAQLHCNDWLKEYVTPLFLISYGLLVYMINARSQAGLTATVLSAGELINRSLDGTAS